MDADVSSREDACSDEPSARDWLELDICSDAADTWTEQSVRLATILLITLVTLPVILRTRILNPIIRTRRTAEIIIIRFPKVVDALRASSLSISAIIAQSTPLIPNGA